MFDFQPILNVNTPIGSSLNSLFKVFWLQNDLTYISSANELKSTTPEDGATYHYWHYREFALKFSVWWTRTQKQSCRSLKGLSIGMNTFNIGVRRSWRDQQKGKECHSDHTQSWTDSPVEQKNWSIRILSRCQPRRISTFMANGVVSSNGNETPLLVAQYFAYLGRDSFSNFNGTLEHLLAQLEQRT